MAFDLPDLPYAYDALEPVIDAQTMQVHHDKHHNKYTTKLNEALEGTDRTGWSIEAILGDLGSLPPEKQTPVRNHGGGYYNHTIWWPMLTSPSRSGQPAHALSETIESDLGGMERFKEQFTNAALGRFGSGWAWLIVTDVDHKLAVTSTPNQDNPLMRGVTGQIGVPILGIDVWEHAYYLKYQNRRPDYVSAFFEVINWEQVSRNFEAAKAQTPVA